MPLMLESKNIVFIDVFRKKFPHRISPGRNDDILIFEDVKFLHRITPTPGRNDDILSFEDVKFPHRIPPYPWKKLCYFEF